MGADVNRIFKVSTDKSTPIYPPNQVFVNTDFEFIVTLGGDLVDNELEYGRLTDLLRKIGETEITILENIGVSNTDREVPYETTFGVNDPYQKYEKNVETFGPPFGLMAHDFYVFGQQECWGIYICEFPTINIVACDKSFADAFRKVYLVKGSGYKELSEFVGKEYSKSPDLIKNLLTNYRLANH